MCEVDGRVSTHHTRDTAGGQQAGSSPTPDRGSGHIHSAVMFDECPLFGILQKSTIHLRTSINLLTFRYLLQDPNPMSDSPG